MADTPLPMPSCSRQRTGVMPFVPLRCNDLARKPDFDSVFVVGEVGKRIDRYEVTQPNSGLKLAVTGQPQRVIFLDDGGATMW